MFNRHYSFKEVNYACIIVSKSIVYDELFIVNHSFRGTILDVNENLILPCSPSHDI